MIFCNKEVVTTFKSSLDENHVCFDEYSHYSVCTNLLDLKNLNTTGFIIKLPPFFSYKKLFSAVLFNLAPKISKDLKIHKIVKYSYKTIGVWVSFARTQFNKCV